MTIIRRLEGVLLKGFGRIQAPAAWTLLFGGIITFLGVVFGLIATGDAHWATLLISADLIVGGFAATQELYQQRKKKEAGGEHEELHGSPDR